MSGRARSDGAKRARQRLTLARLDDANVVAEYRETVGERARIERRRIIDITDNAIDEERDFQLVAPFSIVLGDAACAALLLSESCHECGGRGCIGCSATQERDLVCGPQSAGTLIVVSRDVPRWCELRRNCNTRYMASKKIVGLIFDDPCRRSAKVIGISTSRKPDSAAR